jgi:hypothetical protein
MPLCSSAPTAGLRGPNTPTMQGKYAARFQPLNLYGRRQSFGFKKLKRLRLVDLVRLIQASAPDGAKALPSEIVPAIEETVRAHFAQPIEK